MSKPSAPKANTFMRAYSKIGIDLPAIEAIERLQGKVVEWIKCSDRLPEENVKVILYDSSTGVDCGILVDGEWQIITNGGWDGCDNVSHWQNLPEQPELLRDLKR